MALIGKIREKTGLMMLIIGGAMVAFILSDLFSNRGGGPQDRNIGEVAGEAVSLREFETRVGTEADSYRQEFSQNVDGAAMDQLREQVWNEMIRERVLLDQVNRAGFNVTKDEYDDIRFGNNILSGFKSNPNFQDPNTGQVSPEALRNYFASIQQSAPIYQQIQKKRLVEQRKYDKYNTLVKKSLYVNSAEAMSDHTANNAQATFNFVVKRFDSEPDSLYTPTEAEINSFYGKHKDEVKYRQRASRDFEFVQFKVNATVEDKKEALQSLVEIKDEFQNAEEDSLFVTNNSDSRAYSIQPYVSGNLDAITDSLIANATVGTVIGPYEKAGNYELAKIISLADKEEARVRHILLKTNESTNMEKLKARADSIRTVVRRKKNFEEMVTQFSEDPGSVANGGVYEWFDRFKMVPEFTKASFDNPIGTIDIVETQYGVHIIEVLSQRKTKQRNIAVIDRRMKPSPSTFNDVYKMANQFSLENANADSFKLAAERAGLQVTPVEDLKPDQQFVPGLQSPAAVISWAFRAQVGELSEPIEEGESYVIGRLTGIKEAGAPKLEDVREEFIAAVIKEKKAIAFKKQMTGKTDLSALANELSETVRAASDVKLSAYNLPGGFSENEVIGKAFALKPGQSSVPLAGEQGVYVFEMQTVTAAPELSDVNSVKQTIIQRVQGRAENGLYNALKDAAKVTDQRKQYY